MVVKDACLSYQKQVAVTIAALRLQ